MADDEIQSLILRWYLHADLRAGSRAFELLKREWLLPVARFIHRDVMSPDTEDALSSVLLDLLSHSPEKPPRVLAPPEHTSAKGWRSRVLRHALLDVWRRQRSRRAVEQALRAERMGGPATGTAILVDERAAPQPLPSPGSAYEAEAEQRVLLQQMRRAVVQALPSLPVRRRCAVALLLGVDLSAWVDELAVDLGEGSDALHQRLAAANASAAVLLSRFHGDPPAQRAGELSDEQLRILYPTEELSRAREALRKTIERAIKDVQAHLAKGVA